MDRAARSGHYCSPRRRWRSSGDAGSRRPAQRRSRCRRSSDDPASNWTAVHRRPAVRILPPELRSSGARRGTAAPVTSKGSLFNATPKTQTHVLSNQHCVGVPQHHLVPSPRWHFDHAEAMGSCVQPVTTARFAQGKGPTHPATSENCAACSYGDQLESTLDGRSHADPAGGSPVFASFCHNGTAASGKNAGHIADESRVR